MNQAKTWWIGLGVLVAIVVLGGITAVGMMGGGVMGPGMMGRGMMEGYGGQAAQPGFGGWGWGIGMGLGSLMMLAIWVLPIALIVLLVRGTVGHSASSPKTEPPDEILRRRYAAGEIDEETYDRMRQKMAA